MKPKEWEVETLLNERDVSKILRCSLQRVYKMADRVQVAASQYHGCDHVAQHLLNVIQRSTSHHHPACSAPYRV